MSLDSPAQPSDAIPSYLFQRQKLREFVKNGQRRRSRLTRPHSSYDCTVDEQEDWKVEPSYVGPLVDVDVDDYPSLQRTRTDDPNDIGVSSTRRPGFNAAGKLIRRKITIEKQHRRRTIDTLRRISLAHAMPHPALSPLDRRQLTNGIVNQRLRYLAGLTNERSRVLREQGCLIFRSVEAYCRNLYCLPTESKPLVSEHDLVYEWCGLARLCPFCWTHRYITESFFGLRSILMARKSEKEARCCRFDRKLIVVEQDWSAPYKTHPWELLNQLQSRRNELYHETPSPRRTVKAMVQLQYIEPPMHRNWPWLLRRRALLVCDVNQPSFGYPHHGYDVRNKSKTYYHLDFLQVGYQLARAFAYPLAMQLAPAWIVRRLLDMYVRWPGDRDTGFQMFSSRGCLKRESLQARIERYIERNR